MPIAALGDVDLFYEISGSGPLLVLITGLAGVGSYWDPNIGSLSKHFTVFRYDQRGTGRSTRVEGEYSVEILASDLERLLTTLRLPPALLLGHSTGGAISQVLAARRPELIERMVLYASWATLCPQMKLCMEIRQALLVSAGPAAYYHASPLFLYPPRFVCDEWPRIERELNANVANSTTPTILGARIEAVLNFEGRKYLDAIDAPTLVVVADDDILTPPLSAHELAANIRNAQLIRIPYGAHAVSYCDPEAFNAAVLPFLNDERSFSDERVRA